MTARIHSASLLADRAPSECARSMRTVGGTVTPAVLRGGEAGGLDAHTLEHHSSLFW